MAEPTLQLIVCWSPAPRQVLELTLDVPPGSTVQTVIDQLLTHGTADISATTLAPLRFMQAGIWGRKVPLTQTVQTGDRIEFYRPLKVDPKVARRQRFKRQGKGRTGLFANRKSGAAAGY